MSNPSTHTPSSAPSLARCICPQDRRPSPWDVLPPPPAYLPPPPPAYTTRNTLNASCPLPGPTYHNPLMTYAPTVGDPPAYPHPRPQRTRRNPSIVALELCLTDGLWAPSPGVTSYKQVIGEWLPNGKIRLGTRIVCPNFQGWGTGPTDRVRVAIGRLGACEGRTVVMFGTTPRSAGAVPEGDTFCIHLYPRYVSHTGWGEGGEGTDKPWLYQKLKGLLSTLCC